MGGAMGSIAAEQLQGLRFHPELRLLSMWNSGCSPYPCGFPLGSSLFSFHLPNTFW